MGTPKQSTAKLPPPAAGGGKKSRGVKEKHMTESSRSVIRKHVEAEQETEGVSIATLVSQIILEETIEEIAPKLYKRLLDRKCFSFSAYSIWRMVLSNVELCSIRCDPGDPCEDLQQKQLEGKQQEGAERQLLHQLRVVGHVQGQPKEPQHQRQSGKGLSLPEQQKENQHTAQQIMQLCGDLAKHHQQQKIALWTCEEMPQLPALDTWAPGGLTVKSVSPSTIPVSVGKKKGKKTNSIEFIDKAANAKPSKKGAGKANEKQEL